MDERRVPMEAVVLTGGGRRRHVRGIGPDAARLSRDDVAPDQVAVLRLGVDPTRITRVGNGHEAVAAEDLEPVVVVDAGAVPRGARPAPVVVVLHAAADVVRPLHVEAHMIEQAERKIGDEGPGLGPVVRDRDAAVVARDDVLGVRGVDPDGVHVVMRDARGVGLDGLAAVDRHLHADAAHVDDVGIRGIDADLREVHGARVGAVRLAPGAARVVGAPEAGLAGVERDRGGRFDARVEDRGIGAEDVEADATERTGGEPAREPVPALTAVGGLEDPAAGTAAIHAAVGAAALVHRRVEHAWVGGRDGEVVGAGVVITLEHEAPVAAAVGRLVDAASAAGTPERTGRRDVDDVVVGRIDDDPIDVPRVAQPHVREGRATVGGLVHALAPARGLAIVRLAGADPDEIRVRLRHRDVADRHEPLVLQERGPQSAVGRGLPDAAVGRAHIVERRILLVDGDVRDAARHGGGTDRAEMQRVELGRDGELGLGRHGDDRNERGGAGEAGQVDHGGSPHTEGGLRSRTRSAGRRERRATRR